MRCVRRAAQRVRAAAAGAAPLHPVDADAGREARVDGRTGRPPDCQARRRHALTPSARVYTCSPVHLFTCLPRLVGSSGSASPKSPRRSATCRFTCPRLPSTGTSNSAPSASTATILVLYNVYIVRVRYVATYRNIELTLFQLNVVKFLFDFVEIKFIFTKQFFTSNN